MKAVVEIRFRHGVLDPEAEAIRKGLEGMGFAGVDGVAQARIVELELEAETEEAALAAAREMADRLLANPVIETFDVRLAE